MRDYLNSGDLFRVARASNQQTISCLLLGKNPKTLSKALKLFRSFEGPFHISKNKKSKSLWKIKKKRKKKKVFVLLTIISALRKGGEKNNNKE